MPCAECVDVCECGYSCCLVHFHFTTQHGADTNRRNRDNMTPLDLVKEQEGDIADLLRGDSALLDACKKGDLDRVKKLLTPENINCRDEQGRNSAPLHLAGECLCGVTHTAY